jgi:hypothetical protein
MRRQINQLLIILSVFSLTCMPRSALTKEEMNKLDPTLQRLVSGENVGEDELGSTVRANGAKEYGVIVRSSDPDELKNAGFHLNSVFGEVVTVRVTTDELRRLVKLPSVRFVEAGSKNYPLPR